MRRPTEVAQESFPWKTGPCANTSNRSQFRCGVRRRWRKSLFRGKRGHAQTRPIDLNFDTASDGGGARVFSVENGAMRKHVQSISISIRRPTEVAQESFPWKTGPCANTSNRSQFRY